MKTTSPSDHGATGNALTVLMSKPWGHQTAPMWKDNPSPDFDFPLDLATIASIAKVIVTFLKSRGITQFEFDLIDSDKWLEFKIKTVIGAFPAKNVTIDVERLSWNAAFDGNKFKMFIDGGRHCKSPENWDDFVKHIQKLEARPIHQVSDKLASIVKNF